MKKRWQVKAGQDKPFTSLRQLEECLLSQRGVARHARRRFFEPSYERDIYDPLLLSDIQKAVDRLVAAATRRQRILVWGDYDVDGITATAQLVSVLQQLGAEVAPYIPHRFEDGYGINAATLKRLSSEFDLLVTADCGISAAAEISWLATQGKDTIIVDHHEIPLPEALPPAYALLHPRHPAAPYPCLWLSAAGVAWKVCQGLLRHPKRPTSTKADEEKWLLDLAVLGTVADMVPLVDENRLIVQFGLEVLRRTHRPGIQTLLSSLRLKREQLSVEDLSWRLIPRLNAAGKMDHAQPALDLLLTPHETEARHIVNQLNQHNTNRQAATARVLAEAESQIENPTAPFIFASSATWPAGVVGLVAGRLSQKFLRPAVVVGSNGRHSVGSARGTAAANVLDLLRGGEQYFLKWGGHARAAGFSVETTNVTALQQSLVSHSAHVNKSEDQPPLGADAAINPHLVTRELLALSDRFAPFGQGNEQPIFVAQRLPLVDKRIVGKDKQHAQFTFMTDAALIPAIGFNLAPRVEKLGKYVDAIFTLSLNEFRGRRAMQLEIRDIATAGTVPLEQYA